MNMFHWSCPGHPTAQAVLVYNSSSQSLEKVVGGSAAFVGLCIQAGVLYTAFFSLSAAAFLCTCGIQRVPLDSFLEVTTGCASVIRWTCRKMEKQSRSLGTIAECLAALCFKVSKSTSSDLSALPLP